MTIGQLYTTASLAASGLASMLTELRLISPMVLTRLSLNKPSERYGPAFTIFTISKSGAVRIQTKEAKEATHDRPLGGSPSSSHLVAQAQSPTPGVSTMRSTSSTSSKTPSQEQNVLIPESTSLASVKEIIDPQPARRRSCGINR